MTALHILHTNQPEKCDIRTVNLPPSSLYFGARLLYLGDIEASLFVFEEL